MQRILQVSASEGGCGAACHGNAERFGNEGLKVPPTFDSLYLHHEPEISYQRDYVVFEADLALLIYIVHFSLDSNSEEIRSCKCYLCPEAAKFYCKLDEVYLWINCDVENHNTTLTNRHERILTQEWIKTLSPCQEHPDLQLNTNCTVCEKLLCDSCETATHSTPPHSVIAITAQAQLILNREYERFEQRLNMLEQRKWKWRIFSKFLKYQGILNTLNEEWLC